MFYTDIGVLRTRIGEKPNGRETESVLNVVDDMFAEVDAPALPKLPAPKRKYALDLESQLDRVLGIVV